MNRLPALCFFVSLIVCSTTVYAQDEDGRQIPSRERQSKLSDINQPTGDEIVLRKTLDRDNFKDLSAKDYFRSNVAIKTQRETVVFARENAKPDGLKIRADTFAAPIIKSDEVFNRRRDAPVRDLTKKLPLIFRTNDSAERKSKDSRPIFALNSDSLALNRKASRAEKDTSIRDFASPRRNANPFDDDANAADNNADQDDALNKPDEGFRWRSAIQQSLMFLGIQHGYALTQPKTRAALKGKFWKDYAASVKSLSGWADGGRFFTNYIAHPMQGSFTGFIYVQNDPKGLKQEFGGSKDYWTSRLKAMAWSAAWSTQFEIGPISQASIGNVGLNGKQTYVDIVMTPLGGTAMLVAEDAVDRFIMKRIERATDNFYAIIFSRMLLSPTRTVANLFRFKTPWYRDRPRAK